MSSEYFLMRPGSPVEVEALIRTCAVHEGGHVAMFEFCGVDARATIEITKQGNIMGAVTDPVSVGITGYQISAVGWAGILSEAILSARLRPDIKLPELNCHSVRNLWAPAVWNESRFSILSVADMAMIRKAADPFQAAQCAYLFLTSADGAARLVDTVRQLHADFREEYDAFTAMLGRERADEKLAEDAAFRKAFARDFEASRAGKAAIVLKTVANQPPQAD